jgi:hypothetical protein
LLINFEEKIMKTILKSTMAVALLAVSGASFAASVDTNFTGTIGNNCSLTAVSDGTLKQNTSSVFGDVINSTAAGATAGTIQVTCNTTGTLTVANPVGVGAAAITTLANPSNFRWSAITDASTATQYAAAGGAGSSVPTGLYYVHATLGTPGTALPAGDYAVKVTSTLVAD